MSRIRRASTILFSASQFRVGQSSATPFSIDEPGRDQETSSPSFSGSKTVPEPNLTVTQRKIKAKPVRQLRITVSLVLCCLLVYYFLSHILRSVECHMACILPLRMTRAILWSNIQCDWHQTTFSAIIPFGHDYASLKTGAVVSPKLTTRGLDPIPPSTVLNNSAGSCWSFRNNAGTFGVVLDSPNVMPSHIVIQHRPFNSTTSLARAPRQVTVWGLVDGEQNMKTYSRIRHTVTSALARVPPFPLSKQGTFLPLVEVDFDITARSLRQAFPLVDEALSWGIDFGVIVFDIHSNWGADITSLCNVHIYGHRVMNMHM